MHNTLIPGQGRWSRTWTRGRSSCPSLSLHWSLPSVPLSHISTRRSWGSPGASSSLLLSRCCLVTKKNLEYRVMFTLPTLCMYVFFILVLIKFYSILIQNLKQELLKNSPYNKMEQNFDCHPSDKIVCYNYFFSKNELCFFLELHPPWKIKSRSD